MKTFFLVLLISFRSAVAGEHSNSNAAHVAGFDYGISDLTRCMVDLHLAEQLPPILQYPGRSRRLPSLAGKLRSDAGIFIIDPGNFKTYFTPKGKVGEAGVWNQWVKIEGMPPILASIDAGGNASARFPSESREVGATVIKPVHIASNSGTAFEEIRNLFSEHYLRELKRTAKAEDLPLAISDAQRSFKMFKHKALSRDEAIDELRTSTWQLNYYSRLPSIERLEGCTKFLLNNQQKEQAAKYLIQIKGLADKIKDASSIMHQILLLNGKLEM